MYQTETYETCLNYHARLFFFHHFHFPLSAQLFSFFLFNGYPLSSLQTLRVHSERAMDTPVMSPVWSRTVHVSRKRYSMAPWLNRTLLFMLRSCLVTEGDVPTITKIPSRQTLVGTASWNASLKKIRSAKVIREIRCSLSKRNVLILGFPFFFELLRVHSEKF